MPTAKEDQKFKILYGVYFKDLSGSGVYKKHKYSNRKKDIIWYNPNEDEIKYDMDYLNSNILSWNIIIKNERHSEKSLRVISLETRKVLKELRKTTLLKKNTKPPCYQLNHDELLLYSKFVFLVAKEYSKSSLVHDCSLSIFANKISIDETSMIQILMGHYGERTKCFFSGKSHFFESEALNFRYIHLNLQNLFDKFNTQSFTFEDFKNGELQYEINFTLKRIHYVIWIKKNARINYLRIRKLHGLDEAQKKVIFENKFSSIIIDDETVLYKKRENQYENLFSSLLGRNINIFK